MNNNVIFDNTCFKSLQSQNTQHARMPTLVTASWAIQVAEEFSDIEAISCFAEGASQHAPRRRIGQWHE